MRLFPTFAHLPCLETFEHAECLWVMSSRTDRERRIEQDRPIMRRPKCVIVDEGVEIRMLRPELRGELHKPGPAWGSIVPHLRAPIHQTSINYVKGLKGTHHRRLLACFRVPSTRTTVCRLSAGRCMHDNGPKQRRNRGSSCFLEHICQRYQRYKRCSPPLRLKTSTHRNVEEDGPFRRLTRSLRLIDERKCISWTQGHIGVSCFHFRTATCVVHQSAH